MKYITSQTSMALNKRAIFKNILFLGILIILVFNGYEKRKKDDIIEMMAYGNSMYPTIQNTTLLKIDKSKDLLLDDIQLNEIITYYNSENGYITHRVIDIKYDEKGKYYILKGDNNDVIDPFKVRNKNVLGVVKFE